MDTKDNLKRAQARALQESQTRHAARQSNTRKTKEPSARAPKEIGGRAPDSPEPTRYGDWEKDGIASDF